MIFNKTTSIYPILFLVCSFFGLSAHCNAQSKIENVAINKNGILKWDIRVEKSYLKGQVEHFRWNKWIVISTFKNDSLLLNNHLYSGISSLNYHTGINKFRIRITAPDTVVSNEITFTTKSKKEKCTIIKIDNTIHFETKTKYEIWDSKGAV
ncbi:MAG: hypothetical protein ABL940_12235, partial [Bacteroidia bacterium]